MGLLHCVYKIETRALCSVVVTDLLIIYSGIVLTSAAAEVIRIRDVSSCSTLGAPTLMSRLWSAHLYTHSYNIIGLYMCTS